MKRKIYLFFSLSVAMIAVCYLFFYSDAVRVLTTEVVSKSLTASEEIYFRSAKIDSVYRKHEGYKYFRFVKKLDDVELSSNLVEGSDSVLVIVDDRYKLRKMGANLSVTLVNGGYQLHFSSENSKKSVKNQ